MSVFPYSIIPNLSVVLVNGFFVAPKEPDTRLHFLSDVNARVSNN